MALPETVPVKISSEAGGDISMTPVVAQVLPVADLLEIMLGVCGKDAARICELLERGSVVQGASRFRWTGMRVGVEEVGGVLARFPDPDPALPFRAEQCILVRVCAAGARTEVPRELGSKRRLLKRRSFWDAAMEVASSAACVYVDYSYRDRADRYRAKVDAAQARALQAGARLLRYSGMAAQIERYVPQWLELSTTRE